MAGYLRVVLGEEVCPSGRHGDANDKDSLDWEETEDTVGLSADRHFPLNIQETGINREGPEEQSLTAELRINRRAPESMWGDGEGSSRLKLWNLNLKRTEDWQLKTGDSKAHRCTDATAGTAADALPYLRTRSPPSLSASHICSLPSLSNVANAPREHKTTQSFLQKIPARQTGARASAHLPSVLCCVSSPVPTETDRANRLCRNQGFILVITGMTLEGGGGGLELSGV